MAINDIIALCIGGAIFIGIVLYLVINQKKKILEWLKYAVTEAEKLLGGGTGQLKLRKVFDWFCEKFPIISAILPFKVFSAWVDVALSVVNKWLETNGKIEVYVNGSRIHE